jgi:Fe-S cluster biosynthesis and repair protein YggX
MDTVLINDKRLKMAESEEAERLRKLVLGLDQLEKQKQ